MKTLVFHKLMSRFSWGITNYTPYKFDILLEHLAQNGHSLCSDAPSDDESLLITFDDGYAHLADNLPPSMEKYSYNPTIFVPTALIGQTNNWDYSYLIQSLTHLSKEQLRSLANLGVRIGSHGHNHVDLTNLSTENLRDDLYNSRTMLQDIIGCEVDSISYPFGRCNSRVTDMAAECGYKTGYTMCFPKLSDNPLCLGRMPVYGIDTPLSVTLKLSGGLPTQVERAKSAIIHSFSAGTGLLNQIRGKRS